MLITTSLPSFPFPLLSFAYPLSHIFSKPVASLLLCPPRSITHIPSTAQHKEEHNLEEEPTPAPPWLLARVLILAASLPRRSRLVGRRIHATLGIIQILRRHTDDVVVV